MKLMTCTDVLGLRCYGSIATSSSVITPLLSLAGVCFVAYFLTSASLTVGVPQRVKSKAAEQTRKLRHGSHQLLETLTADTIMPIIYSVYAATTTSCKLKEIYGIAELK